MSFAKLIRHAIKEGKGGEGKQFPYRSRVQSPSTYCKMYNKREANKIFPSRTLKNRFPFKSDSRMLLISIISYSFESSLLTRLFSSTREEKIECFLHIAPMDDVSKEEGKINLFLYTF